MASKPNIRSIRFSDDLAELIDRQVGNSFTEKFENLVTRCVWELPKKEEELKKIQNQIDERKKELKELLLTARKWRGTMQNVSARIGALEATIEKEADVFKL